MANDESPRRLIPAARPQNKNSGTSGRLVPPSLLHADFEENTWEGHPGHDCVADVDPSVAHSQEFPQNRMPVFEGNLCAHRETVGDTEKDSPCRIGHCSCRAVPPAWRSSSRPRLPAPLRRESLTTRSRAIQTRRVFDQRTPLCADAIECQATIFASAILLESHAHFFRFGSLRVLVWRAGRFRPAPRRDRTLRLHAREKFEPCEEPDRKFAMLAPARTSPPTFVIALARVAWSRHDFRNGRAKNRRHRAAPHTFLDAPRTSDAKRTPNRLPSRRRV